VEIGVDLDPSSELRSYVLEAAMYARVWILPGIYVFRVPMPELGEGLGLAAIEGGITGADQFLDAGHRGTVSRLAGRWSWCSSREAEALIARNDPR
jgi:hypothetical protein